MKQKTKVIAFIDREVDEGKVGELLTQLKITVDQLRRAGPPQFTNLRQALKLMNQIERDLARSQERHARYDPQCELLLHHAVHRASDLASLVGYEAAPQFGEKLLSLVVTPARLEEAMGDLEQGYRCLIERHGATFARCWYYFQVLGIATRGTAKALVGLAREWFLTHH